MRWPNASARGWGGIAAGAFGGVTGGGTDLVVALFRTLGLGVFQSVLAQGLVSDPLDKTISFTVVFILLIMVISVRRATAPSPSLTQPRDRRMASGVESAPGKGTVFWLELPDSQTGVGGTPANRLAVAVEAEADGQVLEEAILSPGYVKEYSATNNIQVRTGNAAGVQLTLNGEVQPSLGNTGDIVDTGWALENGVLVVQTPVPDTTTTPSPFPSPAPSATVTSTLTPQL